MTYIEAIQKGFPGVQCHSDGLDDSYEAIVWDSGTPLPSKAALDEWMLANPETPVSDKRITVLAFRNRFTTAEKMATEMAALDNPAASAQARQFSAAVRVILRDSEAASFIDLSRPETRAGVQMLEQYGVIGTGRSIAILDNPILDVERPLTRDYYP